MRSVIFLSVTYEVDGLSKSDRNKEVGYFYFLMFCVFLVMDIVELKG